MKWFKAYTTIIAIALLSACASSPFVSSWLAPDASPLQVTGSKVVVIAMSKNEGTRRVAEDALARELTARGAIGLPLYQFAPNADPKNEAVVQKALEEAGIDGVIVMRPVGTQTKVSSTPNVYHGPRYSGLWGGYYRYGWNDPYYGGSEIRTDTIVHIETLIYSAKQNKLVWGGQSKSTNPSNIDKLVKDTAKKVGNELVRLGLITK